MDVIRATSLPKTVRDGTVQGLLTWTLGVLVSSPFLFKAGIITGVA